MSGFDAVGFLGAILKEYVDRMRCQKTEVVFNCTKMWAFASMTTLNRIEKDYAF